MLRTIWWEDLLLKCIYTILKEPLAASCSNLQIDDIIVTFTNLASDIFFLILIRSFQPFSKLLFCSHYLPTSMLKLRTPSRSKWLISKNFAKEFLRFTRQIQTKAKTIKVRLFSIFHDFWKKNIFQYFLLPISRIICELRPKQSSTMALKSLIGPIFCSLCKNV